MEIIVTHSKSFEFVPNSALRAEYLAPRTLQWLETLDCLDAPSFIPAGSAVKSEFSTPVGLWNYRGA